MTYQCHNRAPFKPSMRVQDGWQDIGASRIPVMVDVPFVMSMDCEYSTDPMVGSKDADCFGCPWKVEAQRG